MARKTSHHEMKDFGVGINAAQGSGIKGPQGEREGEREDEVQRLKNTKTCFSPCLNMSSTQVSSILHQTNESREKGGRDYPPLLRGGKIDRGSRREKKRVRACGVSVSASICTRAFMDCVTCNRWRASILSYRIPTCFAVSGLLQVPGYGNHRYTKKKSCARTETAQTAAGISNQRGEGGANGKSQRTSRDERSATQNGQLLPRAYSPRRTVSLGLDNIDANLPGTSWRARAFEVGVGHPLGFLSGCLGVTVLHHDPLGNLAEPVGFHLLSLPARLLRNALGRKHWAFRPFCTSLSFFSFKQRRAFYFFFYPFRLILQLYVSLVTKMA